LSYIRLESYTIVGIIITQVYHGDYLVRFSFFFCECVYVCVCIITHTHTHTHKRDVNPTGQFPRGTSSVMIMLLLAII